MASTLFGAFSLWCRSVQRGSDAGFIRASKSHGESAGRWIQPLCVALLAPLLTVLLNVAALVSVHRFRAAVAESL
jgi:hypothetical protein